MNNMHSGGSKEDLSSIKKINILLTFQKECVMRITGWMLLGLEQGIKVPEAAI